MIGGVSENQLCLEVFLKKWIKNVASCRDIGENEGEIEFGEGIKTN